jgi:hypothetical protein
MKVKHKRPAPKSPQPFEDYAMPVPLRAMLSAKELSLFEAEHGSAELLDALRFDQLRLEPSS